MQYLPQHIQATEVQFHVSELPIIAMLMSITGFGETNFWKLYHYLRGKRISFCEFWNAANIQDFSISNKIVLAIQKYKKEYKNNDYINWLHEQHISIFFCIDEHYPRYLKTIDLPPPLLFGRGQAIETKTSLAVIGTRQMTSYGEQVISQWIPEFVAAQIPIVSGAVMGVDRTAQQQTLANNGQTIAVLGHGLLGRVSLEQQRLLANWQSQGAWLLSGFEPRVDPSKGTFLARNRIVAGISKAILVIEAAARSGTTHTVDWAAEFGRQVFAVPGSIFNQFAEGTAALLNQGAQLVTNSESVIAAVTDECCECEVAHPKTIELEGVLSATEKAVWQIVRAKEIQLNTLLAQLLPNYSLSEVLAALSNLEVKKIVIQDRGWVLAGKHNNK